MGGCVRFHPYLSAELYYLDFLVEGKDVGKRSVQSAENPLCPLNGYYISGKQIST
jgi:hypothetical protein